MTTLDELKALKGDPKAIYKLLKTDQIPVTIIDQAFELGFPDETPDPEDNELHAQMYGGIAASKTRQRDAAVEAQAAQLAQDREAALSFLTFNGVNPETVPVGILDEIAASMKRQDAAEEGIETITPVSKDDDEMMLVTESGEVIAFLDAPHDELERRLILEWVGERLTRSSARKAGLMAEKQAWLDKINKTYDPQINRQTRIQDRLRYLYEPVAESYLREVLDKIKSGTKPRSLKVGLLNIGFSKTSARIDIVDEEKAKAYLQEAAPEALKPIVQIMKSLIPAALKPKLTAETKTETGIFAYPGGEDSFSMK